MNIENLHVSHKLNFAYQIASRLCKLDKVKSEIAGACSKAFLKLKNLNETNIKNPSYSGDQLIRVKSLQDTKLHFGSLRVITGHL